MKSIKILIILLITILSISKIFCADTNVNTETEKESAAGRQNKIYRPHRKAKAVGGLGIIAGFGAEKGFGDINYEWLNSQASTDTSHTDDKKHATVFGAGIRYGYSYFLFLPVGFKIDLLYQRFGLTIDNSKSVNSGIQSKGNDISLKLDYIYLNPGLTVGFMNIGLYFGVLLNANADDLDVYDKFGKFDFGFTVSVEIPIITNKYNDAVMIIFEGVFGTIDILKDSSRNLRNLCFYFKLAYLFNIKNRGK